MKSPSPLPTLLLIPSLITLLSLHQILTPTKPLSITCTAPTWLIGQSHPSTLPHFLSQFDPPPPDICILLSGPPSTPHPNFHILPHPPSHLLLTAISSGAHSIFRIDDTTHFYTVHYGVGKDDVSNTTSLFSDLLPQPKKVRWVQHPALANPAAILRGTSVYPAGLPLSFLANQSKPPVFDTLPNRTVNNVIFHYIPNVAPPTHPIFKAASRHHPLEDVLQPDAETPSLRAVAVAGLAPLHASPTLYPREFFWALAADDVLLNFAVQRVLQGCGKEVVFVGGGLDVWSVQDGDVKESLVEDGRIEKVVDLMGEMEVGGRVEVMFVKLVREMAKGGMVSWGKARQVAKFVDAVRKMGIGGEICKRGREVEEEVTAVCVTGQMRAAPFTAENIREVLGGIGRYETFVVAARDDRAGALELFQPVKWRYSRRNFVHDVWIEGVRNSSVLHETMMTERQLRNYLFQLWDMRVCLDLVLEREWELGRRFEYMLRVRPDTVFVKGVDREVLRSGVVYGKRQSYYAMNDRFFGGGRMWMGRLMSCHDLFWMVVGGGKVFHRKAGDETHMLWKKTINSERFLARCASWKRVPLRGVGEVEVRRVAWSGGVARWREFDRRKVGG